LWETTDRSAAVVETELGTTPGLLNKRKRQLRANGEAALPGRESQTAKEEKTRRLERELAIVRKERDVPQKAVAIFSNPKS